MLEADVTELVSAGSAADRARARATFAELREALSSGRVRAAEPDPANPAGWRVNTWVKQGILLGFRFGDMVDASMDHGRVPFYDKDTLPLKKPGLGAGVRIVPGGSAVRDGAFLAPPNDVVLGEIGPRPWTSPEIVDPRRNDRACSGRPSRTRCSTGRESTRGTGDRSHHRLDS